MSLPVARVKARLAGGGTALVALDFDGTLTEIVDDPDRPRLTDERRRILESVPAPARCLAIVSGRGLADVRARVGVERAIYVGNHGLEIEGPGIPRDRAAGPDVEARLERLLATLPLDDAATIENKELTATVHVRPREDASRHAAVGAAIRPSVEEAGFDLRAGKAAWEIRPRGLAHKGDALLRLIDLVAGASPERTLYIGDDATDEDAFRAIPAGVTVRVGAAGVPSAARYRLADPAAVYAFIARLIAA